MTRRRRFLAMGTLLLAGTLGGFVAAEAILRIVGAGDPSLGCTDDLTGWSARPHAAAMFHAEGEAYAQMNAEGFHDREHAIEKPAGVLRIAVLGDSFTEALQVPAENSFCAVLERRLRACDLLRGKRAEVLNFGVSGFGTDQEYLVLKHRVLRYKPDLVLLAFFPGNDVKDNTPVLAESNLKPFFVRRGSDLVIDASFRHQTRYWLRTLSYFAVDHSRIAQLLKRCVRSWEARQLRKQSVDPILAENPPQLYREPTEPEWIDAWLTTEALLTLMGEEAEAGGARFGIITLTTALQVLPGSDRRQHYMELLGVPSLDYTDSRVAAVALRNGFSVLNLAPEMRKTADETRTTLHGFPNAAPESGHWNSNGHRLAGELIAAWVCHEFATTGNAIEDGRLEGARSAQRE